MHVADIMSTDIISLAPDATLLEARKIMQAHHIRHVPVVTATGEFVGLVSQRDVYKAAISQLADVSPEEQEDIETNIPLSAIMVKEVLTVPPDYLVQDAARLFLAHKFGCLPVLEHGILRGIITESDFVTLSLSLLDVCESAPEK